MTDEDWKAFTTQTNGLKPIGETDKVTLTKNRQSELRAKQRKSAISKAIADDRKQRAEFAFSDAFQAVFPEQGPLRYSVDKTASNELKRIRRGDYIPDLILDCHGLTREESKREIAALIYEALKQQYRCVCIVHGIGSGVLRQQIPNWLVQHPDILAFHQAPLEWGGQGALLVLLKSNDPALR